MNKTRSLPVPAFAHNFVSWVVAVICMLSVSAAWAQGGLGIAAVVNDDVITMLDLNARMTMIMQSSDIPNTPDSRARIAPQVLRTLIDEKLKLQETRRQGITIEQKEIETNLQGIAQNNNMTVEQLTQNLRSVGVPVTSLTSRLEAELAWRQYVARRLSRQLQVGEEEITDEINRIQKNAGTPEYQIAEIFLSVDSPSEDTQVRDTAERMVMQIRQGASFAALAENFSAAPSAAVGGDVGWVQYSNLDPELLKVLRQMQPNRLSNPIRSLGGYYILLLRDVRTSPGIMADEATVKLSQYHMPVTNMDDPQALAATRQKLLSATTGMSSCEQMNAASENSGSLMSGSLGEMKLSTLPDNLRGALNNLPVGQPSQPVATGGGLAVMMICERSDAEADMDKIRTDIRYKLLEDRVNVAAQRKLHDLRREAFVDVRL